MAMDLMELREYCLSFPDTEETTPFDEETLVYKVAGKMFALTNMVETVSVALKCDPERALELRDGHDEIMPAFHMNKKHWNDVMINGDLPSAFIRQLIRESYILVVNGFPRLKREEISKKYIDVEDELKR